jgi:hypothetical protein
VYLRDVVELEVRNVSDEPRAVVRPTASSLSFDITGTETSWPPGTWEANPPQRTIRLRPGAAIPLIGDGAINPDLEFALDHPKPEPVRIRATFRPYADRPGVHVVSDWVDVDLTQP